MFQVLFVDHGNVNVVNVADVYERPSSASDGIPPLAVPIVLNDVVDDLSVLPQVQKDAFKASVFDKKISIRMGMYVEHKSALIYFQKYSKCTYSTVPTTIWPPSAVPISAVPISAVPISAVSHISGSHFRGVQFQRFPFPRWVPRLVAKPAQFEGLSMRGLWG